MLDNVKFKLIDKISSLLYDADLTTLEAVYKALNSIVNTKERT